jgi:hypothetical protein
LAQNSFALSNPASYHRLSSEGESMERCLRAVVWRNEENQLFEYCSLKSTGESSRLEGIVVAVVDEKPVRIAYRIACDRQGLTQTVAVDAGGGLGAHHIRLAVDEQRTWTWNGNELPGCKGCSDVDLGFSPATNSLPIRRLNLNPGESQTLTAAWVRFPQFDVIAFPQRYTRLEQNRYLFESLLDDFKAELVVDELGIVQQYGQYWQAVATSEG